MRWFLTACYLLVVQAASGQDPAAVGVTFLDVGQGDAVLVQSPGGKTMLVDAGPSPGIVQQLSALDVSNLDLLVASHPHADHIGGMAAVLDGFPVAYYLDSGRPHTTRTYSDLLEALQRSTATYLRPTERRLELGEVVVTVIPPPADASDLNNASVGLLVEYGEFRVLLTGDSEVEEINYFLGRGVPNVTVLKAAHHGSRNGVTPAWIAATRPEVVVISVGAANTYGHPHPWALRYYHAGQTTVLRTDIAGTVRIDGRMDGSYSVFTSAGAVAAYGDKRPVRRVAPTIPTAPTTAAPGALSLHVVADAPGNDHYNRNGEYVVVSNAGGTALLVGGYVLCDAASHCFRFPAGATVPAGGRVVLYTGNGESDGERFFMNSGRAVWNNTGDVATLVDREGRVVARYVY